MSVKSYPTANSKTSIAFNEEWLVLDIGSGHNPHKRADVIVDRYLTDEDNVAGRSGRAAKIPDSKLFVLADGNALPFRDGAFDFSICSHVLEHIPSIDTFCTELNRVASAGYIETPSKCAELIRHAPYHIWFVSAKENRLIFEPAQPAHPLGAFGKLFFSIYFYQGKQLDGKDVFHFAYGCPQPLHLLLFITSFILKRLWIMSKHITYTRLEWDGGFGWQVRE